MSPPRAVVLFSGGLDSILAVKLLEEQGVATIPLHLTTPFAGDPSNRFREKMRRLFGIGNIMVKDLSMPFWPLLFDPPHGFGSQMNPCIDCKILFLKAARETMEELGADLLATGEVVGQRPFSQRKEAMRLIEREAGTSGILLRPLSARLLPPTVAEEKGLIDRSRLLDMKGRGRKPQLELARRYGLKEIPSPAGGCLLTDPGYSRRLRALLPFLRAEPSQGQLSLVRLLGIGRLFKIGDGTLLVVARTEPEARRLRETPVGISMDLSGVRGVMIPAGEPQREELELAGAILARYARGVEGTPTLEYEVPGRERGKVGVSPMPPEEVEAFLVR